MSIFNIQSVKRITAEARGDISNKPSLTEDQQRILDAVNNGRWGCQNESVRNLVTAITGIDCTEARRGPYKVGSLVVFTNDDIQETLIIRALDSDGAALSFTADGNSAYNKGNNSYLHPSFMTDPTSDWKVRWATDEEIDAFFGVA